jgi:hypothetical protein
MASALRRLGTAAAALGLMALSSCLWNRTQLWPEPMSGPDPSQLPPGDTNLHQPGPEEVSVLRHSDPVRVRPAGALAGHPLAFFEKRARLTAGGSVIVAPGGRAEVLWPSKTSIVLLDECIGWVGSPSRGEPLFEFQQLDSARLDLSPGDRVRLLGGAILSGNSGPYMLDRTADQILRVRNQSKERMTVAFREEIFDLDPGQSLVLPLLSSGGAPRNPDPGLQRVAGPGFQVELRGALEAEPSAAGVAVRALADEPGERLSRGLGVTVRLAPGERALFTHLGAPAPAESNRP